MSMGMAGKADFFSGRLHIRHGNNLHSRFWMCPGTIIHHAPGVWFIPVSGAGSLHFSIAPYSLSACIITDENMAYLLDVILYGDLDFICCFVSCLNKVIMFINFVLSSAALQSISGCWQNRHLEILYALRK